MDSCFVPCKWKCGYGRLSRIERDRYTDVIDNVLKDKRGRELFKHFIENRGTADVVRASLNVLMFWEDVTTTLSECNNKENPGCSKAITLRATNLIENLLEDANLLDEIEIDLAQARKLKKAYEDARKSQNKEILDGELLDLQTKAKEALEADYKLFKSRLK